MKKSLVCHFWGAILIGQLLPVPAMSDGISAEQEYRYSLLHIQRKLGENREQSKQSAIEELNQIEQAIYLDTIDFKTLYKERLTRARALICLAELLPAENKSENEIRWKKYALARSECDKAIKLHEEYADCYKAKVLVETAIANFQIEQSETLEAADSLRTAYDALTKFGKLTEDKKGLHLLRANIFLASGKRLCSMKEKTASSKNAAINYTMEALKEYDLALDEDPHDSEAITNKRLAITQLQSITPTAKTSEND